MRRVTNPKPIQIGRWLPACVLAAALAGAPRLASAQGWVYSYDASGNEAIRAGSNAALPQILQQPQLQVVAPGELASFTVLLADSSSASYRWQFNGTNIIGATGDALLLMNVGFTNQGQYRVVITNAFGSVTSAPAALLIDSLGGGMPDSWQVAHFGNFNQNPLGDYDGDGVSNLDEYLEGTDPTDPTSYHPRLHLQNTRYGQAFATPGLPHYTLGQYITLTAVPDEGASFVGWSGPVTGTKTDISLLMDGHKTVTASFGEPMSPPVFETVFVAGGMVSLTWSALPGRTYQVQYATNLNQSGWTNLGATTLANDWTVTTYDPAGTNSPRFYRVGLLP